MVAAVLLEWEGVLANTWSARRDALRAALAAEGIAHAIADHDDQLCGLGVTAAVHTVLRHIGARDPVLADLLVTRASRAFAAALATGLTVDPCAVRFVRTMQTRSRVAVVTRASRAETELVLQLAGISDAVTTLICADDVDGLAPGALAYGRAIAHLSRVRPLVPYDALAVVDGGPSIRAAREAGLRVLAVGAPAHEAMEADAAADTLDGVVLDGELLVVAADRGSP
jgi:beta-phosphoglucomutase-like phosphatase (HAD superfamily)